jgi:hypothetical protein
VETGLTIETLAEHDTGTCPCCGHESRSVTGLVYDDGFPLASYNVHWTLDRVPEHGAHWDIVLGDWGEGAGPERRFHVRLAYRIAGEDTGFMVIDAQTAPADFTSLSSHPLRRSDVIGTPLADQVFAICDAIILQDERLKEMAATG